MMCSLSNVVSVVGRGVCDRLDSDVGGQIGKGVEL